MTLKTFLSSLGLLLGASLLLSGAARADHPVPAIQDTETPAQRDARMAWWREARFGMFIHWGLYAVPGGVWNGNPVRGGGEWIENLGKIPMRDYTPLAAQFNPTSFDADAWVAIAKAAGMKYIVITAKHHEGFAMFKSAIPFNIVADTPFKRDPLKELAEACRKQGIKLGFYYSQDQDWNTPGGSAYGGHWDPAQDGSFPDYIHKKVIPQLKELLTNYQPFPAVIWFDTPTGNMTPALASEIVALLNEHPNLIWNNRLGAGYPGDTETPEQHIPPQGYPGRDWEACMTLNGTWGYKTNDLGFKSAETLLHTLIDIASKGGNYLLNVGPDATGTIPAPEAERLRAVGAWLKTNGEAIYGTQRTPFAHDLPWGRVTRRGDLLYLHVFQWPADGKLLVPLRNKAGKAYLLAAPDKALAASATDAGIVVSLPAAAPDPLVSVVALRIEGEADPLPLPPLGAGADGAFQLGGADADLFAADGSAPAIKLEGDSAHPNIGFWTRAQDYPRWRVQIAKPGAYEVSLTYAADPAWEGNEAVVAVGDQTVQGVLHATGDHKTYQTVALGTVHLAQPGTIEVTVKPGKMKNVFCNLRAVTLKPQP